MENDHLEDRGKDGSILLRRILQRQYDTEEVTVTKAVSSRVTDFDTRGAEYLGSASILTRKGQSCGS
jgi:hypothetical protein